MNYNAFKTSIRTTLRGIGQVMFQQSAWTGLLLLCGIFWGAYECHTPAVAWGAVVGVIASTAAGYLVGQKPSDGEAGLWGFNGVLVGCAFPTFLECTWQMWVALIFCSMLTTWVRTGMNNVMAPWKINSLTFPFVLMTWVFLFASRMMDGIAPDALSTPELPTETAYSLATSPLDLVVYWLKGISQVFLINSWVTGIFFLAALAVCSRWAALWAAIGSALALLVAIVFEASPHDIANGLFGFSPVLTGIAIGCTFYRPTPRSAAWSVIAIITTVFVQAAMDVFFIPFGLPTLTGPFCVTTWLFLLPLYRMGVVSRHEEHPEWGSDWKKFISDVHDEFIDNDKKS